MIKVFVATTIELRQWLNDHHQQAESVWLVKQKKTKGLSFISYDELVDELICFGWIDSLPKSLDSEKTMHRISPRNPKSSWSRVNKERVERLLAAGKMAPSGLKLVETAKNNGAWDFLDDVEKLIIPADLQEMLDRHTMANHYFNRFPDSSKRNILEWIKTAKQAITRQKRITETTEKAAINIKANHPEGRDKGPKE